MNFMMIASSPYSHIIPLKILAERLNKISNTKIYCMSLEKNKKLIESLGMIFVAYPLDIKPVSTNRVDSLTIMKNSMKFWNNGQIEEGYNYYIEKDIESLFDIREDEIKALIELLRDLEIDFIFKDAVDKFGDYLGERLNIPVVGYMTHNIYSKKFFEGRPNYYYPIFLNTLIQNRIKYLSEKFFINYRNKCEELYKEFKEKYHSITINPHHQLDPLTDLTIVFSTDFLQPRESLYFDRKYLILYPDIESRKEEVSEEIKIFIEKNKNIIYISSGSITTQLTKYYIDFIGALSKGNYSLIISAGDQNEFLKKYVIDNNLEDKVYISDWIPQRFILEKASLFITSGGQNSLLESIYYGTPMLVTPITSEQRLNGIIIENLGIGFTTYNIRNETYTTGYMVNTLLNDKTVRKNTNMYSKQYREHINDFTLLDNYIKGYCKNGEK